MPFQRPWLLIGVSARIYYPEGPVLDLGGVWTKTLHYLEQSVAHWGMRGGALPVMVPAVDADSIVKRSEVALAHYAEALDGLVLQGGNDLAPESYGETPLHPDWHGDRVRDRYEMGLVAAFIKAGKPVFGICRGFQELNVAFGGTLRRDMAENPALIPHHAPSDKSFSEYFEHLHPVKLVQHGVLERAYKQPELDVVSVHYQGVDRLGKGLNVEATAPDGVVEAISANINGGQVLAVQWHPEWRASENPQSQKFFELLGRALRREPLVQS